MDEQNIRKYAELMQQLELTGLEITENGVTLRLERAPAALTPAAPATSSAAAEAAPLNKEGIFSVVSPLIGVFYAAPAENAKPFVQIGDTVHRGDVLCIVEAMKLMNEITAEQDGIVVDVCVQNNQVVDFGRELFRMRRL